MKVLKFTYRIEKDSESMEYSVYCLTDLDFVLYIKSHPHTLISKEEIDVFTVTKQ